MRKITETKKKDSSPVIEGFCENLHQSEGREAMTIIFHSIFFFSWNENLKMGKWKTWKIYRPQNSVDAGKFPPGEIPI